MNIFFLDRSPRIAAEYHVDKHVVKMILETAQLLSTAHRVLDGKQGIEKKYVLGSFPPRYRNLKRWKLDDPALDKTLYKSTHMNHPSAIWCRSGVDQYQWTYELFVHLTQEYTYRYGKHHKCEQLLDALSHPPKNIDESVPWTEATPAMPDDCKVPGDSVSSYRNYYAKYKIRLAKWSKRNVPSWYTQLIGDEQCQHIPSSILSHVK